jgi:hypothetical protein
MVISEGMKEETKNKKIKKEKTNKDEKENEDEMKRISGRGQRKLAVLWKSRLNLFDLVYTQF